MRRMIIIFAVIGLLFAFTLNTTSATELWFDPDDQLYDVGDTLTIDLYADIDEADTIFGFGFDLSFNGGFSYISGPGDSGSYLTFTGFTANSTYFDTALPPLWDDGDTIAGEAYFGSNVWGTNILLGTFYFDAPSSAPIGVENIHLGAPDSTDPFYPDGLLIGDLMAPVSLMPNNPTATAAPVPEPASILLLGAGIAGIAGFRKKFRKK